MGAPPTSPLPPAGARTATFATRRRALVTYPNGDRSSYVMTVFDCTVIGGTVIGGTAHPDGIEIGALRHVSQAELANLTLADWARVVLPHAFRSTGGARFEPPTWRPRA